MASTRLLIRQTSAARLGGLTTGSVTSSVTAPTSSVTDTDNLLDIDNSDTDIVGNHFMFTEGNNAGVERRVSSYVPSSGALIVGNNFSGDIVSGDDWEMHEHLRPSEWNTAINAALRRCTRRREATVAITDNYNQLSLAALTDLVRENQILDVYTMAGATGQKRRTYLTKNVDWDAWEDDDVVTLNLEKPLVNDATNNLELYVGYLAPYAALTSDSDTTTCDLDWITTATLLQALETYPAQLEEAAKRNMNMTVKDLQKEFRSLSMRLAPKRSTTIGVRFR